MKKNRKKDPFFDFIDFKYEIKDYSDQWGNKLNGLDVIEMSPRTNIECPLCGSKKFEVSGPLHVLGDKDVPQLLYCAGDCFQRPRGSGTIKSDYMLLVEFNDSKQVRIIKIL